MGQQEQQSPALPFHCSKKREEKLRGKKEHLSLTGHKKVEGGLRRMLTVKTTFTSLDDDPTLLLRGPSLRNDQSGEMVFKSFFQHHFSSITFRLF